MATLVSTKSKQASAIPGWMQDLISQAMKGENNPGSVGGIDPNTGRKWLATFDGGKVYQGGDTGAYMDSGRPMSVHQVISGDPNHFSNGDPYLEYDPQSGVLRGEKTFEKSSNIFADSIPGMLAIAGAAVGLPALTSLMGVGTGAAAATAAAGSAAAGGSGAFLGEGVATGVGAWDGAAGMSLAGSGAAAGAGAAGAGATQGNLLGTLFGKAGTSLLTGLASGVVTSLLAPKPTTPGAPPQITEPTPMPDLVKTEQQQLHQTLQEFAQRRGRASTIMTTPGRFGG